MKYLRPLFVMLLAFSPLALRAAPLSWDPGATTGATLGGTGNWDVASSLWYNGTTDVPWNNANNDDAIFSGISGTVTLVTSINAGSIYFTNAVGSYTLTNLTGAETLTLSGGTIDTGGEDHLIGAPISTATLTKTGAGRLHLTADSSATFSGPTVVNQGVISIENNNALGASGMATVMDGAAVEVNGGTAGLATIVTPITLYGNGISNAGALNNTDGGNTWYGAVTLGSTNTTISADTGTLEFDGGVSGNGDVNLTIGGTNNGTVRVRAGGFNLGNGTLTINTAGSFSQTQGSAYTTTYSNLVINRGAFLLGGQEANLGTVPASLLTNQIVLNGGAIGISGTFAINTNRGITVLSNGGTISITSGALTTCGIYSSNVPVTFNCNGGSSTDLLLGAPLNLGTAGYTKNGPETMNLNGKANVCGRIVINGGNLSWGTTETFLGTVPLTLTPDAITLNGGALVPSNSQTVNQNRGITLGTNGGSIGENTSAGTLTIAGVISGPGNFTKLASGANSTVVFSGNNTFTGNVTITTTSLRIGAGGSSGTLGAGSYVTNNGILSFNRSDVAYNYGGTILGTGFVTNMGNGTITLTGSNAYAGGTFIAAGKLLINNNNGSGTGAGSVTVFTNGALGGTGAIAGAVTVNQGGTIAPGAPLGTLTINNNLALAGNVAISINKSLATTNSTLLVTGTLNNTGTGKVTVSNLGPALVTGDKFQLFSQPLVGGGILQVTGGGVVWSNNLAVDGTISVLSQIVVAHPVISSISLSGTNLVLSGTNGSSGASYYLLSTTNLTQPVANWTRVLTNTFDSSGNFSITNGSTNSQMFYLLQLQ